MKRLNARQIEAFRAVMLLGSMTKAAESLDISQPAVSRLIENFTEDVGFLLFRRQQGGIVPTPDAQALLSEVERHFIGLDELSLRVRAMRDREAGHLRVVGLSLYANGLLPEIVAAYLRDHSGIHVSLEACGPDQVVDWVAARRCDVGLASLPVHGADVAIKRLAAQPALCVMPADSPLARAEMVAAGELSGQSFVSFPHATAFRYQVDAIFERLGIERDLRVEAATHESVCNLVAAGVGVSIVSPFSPQSRRNPNLAFRPFTPPIMIEIGVVTDPDHLSSVAASFRDFVCTYFRDRTAGGIRRW